VRSLLSFQLFVRHENLGALNLYADHSAAFTEESQHIGSVLAQHASIAMIGAAAETQFGAALASRDIIGQAKGFIMHRDNLTGIQAFALLLKTSQNANIKLIDVARWVVDQHESQFSPR
jgi:ANTAR domain